MSPPGIGKSQAIDTTGIFWLGAQRLKVSPESITKAALVDAVVDAAQRIMLTATEMLEYSSLLVAAPEFGVLVPGHDLDFLNVLNYLYDNPPYYRERRRHFRGDPIEIYKPQLNILAGTQPAYLANLLPEEAWGMGFMSRMIMVYAREGKYVPLFRKRPEKSALLSKLTLDIRSISKLHGLMTWTPEAEKAMEEWDEGGRHPVPEHSKLEHYLTRRGLHILKLSMIASAARGNDLMITLPDLRRAWAWLFQAEQTMPDVFKDMVYKGDSQIIQELHFFAWKLYAKERKPIHESRLINFLQTKVPSEKIDKILDTADRANIVVRLASTKTYEPRAKPEHGLS